MPAGVSVCCLPQEELTLDPLLCFMCDICKTGGSVAPRRRTETIKSVLLLFSLKFPACVFTSARSSHGFFISTQTDFGRPEMVFTQHAVNHASAAMPLNMHQLGRCVF